MMDEFSLNDIVKAFQGGVHSPPAQELANPQQRANESPYKDMFEYNEIAVNFQRDLVEND